MTRMLSILLIDDEALVREELGEILEEEGYLLWTASDGQEGLSLFEAKRPDMVITDVKMPRTDGLTVAMALRQKAPQVPITIMTGHGSEEMAIHALRAGVTDFLKKPIRIDDLLSAIERMRASLALVSGVSATLPSSAEIIHHGRTYRIANDVTQAPYIVDAILKHAAPPLAETIVYDVSVALRELLLNAIEHGNLELNYEEKGKQLVSGTWQHALAQRASQLPYRDRRVTLILERSPTELRVTLRDEGCGFDWRHLPDPTLPENLLLEHGRGIVLARMLVDELHFNDMGNEVSIVKRLSNERSAPIDLAAPKPAA